MPFHDETNPHFRPPQQREGQPSQPAPGPGVVTPSPGVQPLGQDGRDQQNQQGPRWTRQQRERYKPQQPRSEEFQGEGPSQPLGKQSAPSKDQISQAHDPHHSGGGGGFHTPWYHESDKSHHDHNPQHDKKFNSPWIPLPKTEVDDSRTQKARPRKQDERNKRPESVKIIPPQYQEQDHFPVHFQGTNRPPVYQQDHPSPSTAHKQGHPSPSPAHQQDRHSPSSARRQDRPISLPPNRDGPPRDLRTPAPQRTKPIAWIGAAICAIFWIVIFLGGLIVLIVYLVYRPRSPRFDISSATLNVAYLDAGSLLNADISLLANFTNPNKKVDIDFNHIIIDLYYGNTLIATQFSESFSAPRAVSTLANVHMVTSQVRLPIGEGVHLQEQSSRNAIIFYIKGVFKVRSNLGGFLKYSYRLYGHCTIMVTAPPTGVMRATKCRTKR